EKRVGTRLAAHAVRFHPDGRQLAITFNGGVQVRHLDTGELLAEFPHAGDRRPAVAWHPNGKVLAATTRGRVIRLGGVTHRKQSRRLEGHKGEGVTPCFSPAGDVLASTGWESVLRLWDVRAAQPLFSAPFETMGLGFGPDGRLLAGDHRND